MWQRGMRSTTNLSEIDVSRPRGWGPEEPLAKNPEQYRSELYTAATTLSLSIELE